MFIKVLFLEQKTCKLMDFDKTRLLSGYPITIADGAFFHDPTINNPYKIIAPIGLILKEIFTPLKPKIKIKVVSDGSFSINENGTNIGPSLLKILNGTFDTRAAIAIQRVFGDFWRNELNLFIRGGICYAVTERTATWSNYFQRNYFLQVFVSMIYTFLIFEKIVTCVWKKKD